MGQRRGSDQVEPLLAEQIAYYRAIAREYDDHALREPGGDELLAAFDSFAPTGQVLELACGSGLWTVELLRHAEAVTAVDASPDMLASRRLVDRQRALHAGRLMPVDAAEERVLAGLQGLGQGG